MDTTITISSKNVADKSDFLHLTYNPGINKDAIISVDSSNFGQSGTVSWDKKTSNIEKVTNWMKLSDKDSVKNDSEAKKLILVRCDFNKSTNYPYRSAYENVTLKVPKMLDKEKPDGSFTSDEIPLSPESRKKELCRYLQLMNPADKKEIIILQNRRSTRVRNLAEQKQVQDKIKEINEPTSTLKSFKDLNIQYDKLDEFYFPFPPQELTTITEDFDDTMIKLIPKFKLLQKNKPNKLKTKTLRSNGKFKNIPIKKLIDKNEKKLKSISQRIRKKSTSSQCEIISVQGEDIDLDDFIDDMVDFDKLSEEHKKCLIESRILSTNNGLQMSPLFGFSSSDSKEINKLCEKYKDNLQEEIRELEAKDIKNGSTYLIVNIHTPDTSDNSSSCSLHEHDYASTPSKGNSSDSDNGELDVVNMETKEGLKGNTNNTRENEEYASKVAQHMSILICIYQLPYPITSLNENVKVNTKNIPKKKFEILPYKTSVRTKSLHKSLQYNTKKKQSLITNSNLAQEWDMHNSPKQQLKKQTHFITITPQNGSVLKAFYVGYNLIICQEFLISFWMQTPLGNVLGSQNMWVPRGQTQRLVLNNRCLQKDSMEKVVCLDNSVVYIELWMKEHKSEMRQGPVADVFITLYYWKQRQNGLDKKVLQLENINGFADDVQYCVMKNFPKIIVSWHSANEESTQSRRTFIHAYQLASDYQTVSNIYNMEPIDHYVSSLHNIEDYEDLVMGCGENKITLWNIEFGHIIATVELNDIKTPLSTLWVKCDRGFLFALQQCVDRELRLIAINGINQSWKKLACYVPPEGFDRLKGVCIENGLLLTFYDQGILCWNAETGEPIEEINIENDVITSGSHVILVEDNQIIVKHALTHLMSVSGDDSGN